MDQTPKPAWGREHHDLLERWPKGPDGQPERPIFLKRCSSLDMSDTLLVNLLEAYQIPCLCQYPGDGAFGKLILGMSGQGVDIYVPESLYQDAIELSKGENEHEGL